MLADRLLADEQLACDRRVRPALGHQLEHFTLALTQLAETRVVAGLRQQGRHDLRVEDRAPCSYPAHRLDELGDVGDSVLEEISDRSVAAREQLARVQLLDILREHEDGKVGSRRTSVDRGAQSLVGECRRHTYVDDGDVDLGFGERLRQRRRIVDGSDDLELVRLEHAGEPISQEGEVLGDDNTHGNSMVTVVGPPAGLTTSIVPSKAASRRRTPARPLPPSTPAPPRPSSVTVSRINPFAWRMSTLAAEAFACLPMLASISATAKYAADSTGAGARPSNVTVTSIGIGMSSASARTAPSSPRSASTGGWIPRTTDRRSPSADVVALRASSSRSAALSGSLRSISSAMPRFMPSATSRACAPSCRSRSIRRSSAAEWSMVSARDSATCATRRSSCAREGDSRARSSWARHRVTYGEAYHQINPHTTAQPHS